MFDVLFSLFIIPIMMVMADIMIFQYIIECVIIDKYITIYTRKIRYRIFKTIKKLDKCTMKHAVKILLYTSIVPILISINIIRNIFPRIIVLKDDFLLLGIAIIGTILSFLFIQHKKTKYKLLQIKKVITITLALIFLKILIISDIIKLMFFCNLNFIDSLSRIKPLGYTLGGIIAVLALYVSYSRVRNTEKQHNKTLKELKFKNAVELLSSKTRTSRILGVQSLCELTLKHKKLKFLDSNIKILMLHLEDIYKQETKDLLEYYNKNKNSIVLDKDEYITENYIGTSQEILLTLEHTIKLINAIKPNSPHTNEQYKLSIPLCKVRIYFDELIFKNIQFTTQLHTVMFHQELDNIKFYQKLTNIKFHKKLDNIKFYQKLTNIYFDNNLNNVTFNHELNNIRFYQELTDIKFYSELDYVHFHQKFNDMNFNKKLNNIRFCQELTNVIFKKKVKNVDFNKELTDVEFHEKLEKIYFYEKLNNVVFYGELNNVNFIHESNKISYHKDIVNNIITQHMKNILNNNYTISITINTHPFDQLIKITNNTTQELNITFNITIDDQVHTYDQTLHYNIDTKELLYNDNTLYDKNQFNNDLQNTQEP